MELVYNTDFVFVDVASNNNNNNNNFNDNKLHQTNQIYLAIIETMKMKNRMIQTTVI